MMKAKTTRTPVRISARTVAALSPGESIYDTEIRGFRAVCLPSGKTTFGFQYSVPGGGRPYISLGLLGEVTAEQARTAAKKHSGKVADGGDPAGDRKIKASRSSNTVDHVLDQWLAKYARGVKKLRNADEYENIFRRHVRPAIGDISIYDLTRADVTKMLDEITENGGPVTADRTLAHLRSAFNWWRVRDDQFITMPIVKGMSHTTLKGQARKRSLDVEEVRDLWLALDAIGSDAPPFYPTFVRALLLLGCRRNEVADMHTDEFKLNDWTVPAERYKTKRDHLLPIPATVKAMLPPRKDGFVFSSDGGKTPFSGFSKTKVALDKAIAALRKREGRKPMPAWQLRDLRRTARTMMRGGAKIDDEIGKRILGHVIPGIDGVYNVYDYRDEKAEGLERWATYLLSIVNPPPENLISFSEKSDARPATRRRAGVDG